MSPKQQVVIKWLQPEIVSSRNYNKYNYIVYVRIK